ncbi:MAG TPA: hypothetical protein VGG37_06730 [Opitutaceae bacterium]|jgi:hypothetical protein
MDEEPASPSKQKPSQVPSWVLVGFGLGALFVLALPRSRVAAPPPVAEAPAPPPKAAEEPKITTIEAVFALWDRYAVWSGDTTQVALWDSDTKSYSEYYEVLRTPSGYYYFRSLTSLTRPILTHGVDDKGPLQFTETDKQRQAWLEAVNKENWRSISEGARKALAPESPPAKAPSQ